MLKSCVKNEERKKHVREIIDGTVKELDSYTSDMSSARQTIIDNTHKTLEEANRYLKEADEEDEKGDAKEAYFRLLDSESSAKEAGIFLKSGLKFKDREKEEEKRKQQAYSNVPRGKARRSIFSQKKAAGQQHAETKPATGKQ